MPRGLAVRVQGGLRQLVRREEDRGRRGAAGDRRADAAVYACVILDYSIIYYNTLRHVLIYHDML